MFLTEGQEKSYFMLDSGILLGIWFFKQRVLLHKCAVIRASPFYPTILLEF